MRRFCFFELLLMSFSACSGIMAQPAIINRTGTVNYPEIEVVFHDRNPLAKTKSDFRLLENKQELSFTIESIHDSAGGARDLLILLEFPAWPEYGEQISFFKRILIEQAEKIAGKGNAFRLAVFDWTGPDGKVLQWIKKDAGNDPADLKKLIETLPQPQQSNRIQRATEIYPALAEAVEFMGTLPSDRAKAILLLSAEFSNIYNDKFDDAELITTGRRKDIPLYALRFPHMSQKYSLAKVCEGTYGLHTEAIPENPEKTAQILSEQIDAIIPRSKGREYTLRFTTKQTAGGALQAELMLSAAESIQIRWEKPGVMEVMNRRPWLWSLVLLPLIVLLWFVWYRQKVNKQKTADYHAAQENRYQALKKQTEAELANQAAIREQEKKLLREAEIHAQEKEKWALRNTALQGLQRQPKLVNTAGQSLLISEPEWNIGRADGNHLIVNHQDVSRKHARILFGACPGLTEQEAAGRFFLEDLKSSNGTLHNGRLLREPFITELQSGDTIGVGKQQWSFYL